MATAAISSDVHLALSAIMSLICVPNCLLSFLRCWLRFEKRHISTVENSNNKCKIL